jgi:hypothetical protein
MGDVVIQTGMSERTIYRYITEGKIRQAQRPLPGRKPLTVLHPDDIAAVTATRVRNQMQILPPAAESVKMAVAESVREALLERAIPPAAEPKLLEAPAGDPANSDNGAMRRQDWPLPIMLTEDEAVFYTGAGISFLRRAVHWRRVGPRGAYVCLRIHLDALVNIFGDDHDTQGSSTRES